MHALAQPAVVTKACIAAALSCLACLPRLHLWHDRQLPVWYLAAILLCTGFVLWAFVFAWHAMIAGKEPLAHSTNAIHWLGATAFAAANAAVAFFIFDPKLRAVAPTEFPNNPGSWLADALVSLTFERLFLTFAPVAFLGRLLHNLTAAVILTACFNGFVYTLRATQLDLPTELVLLTIPVRLIGSAISVHFYLKGGVWTILWMTLLMQLRHLPSVLTV